jgi:alkanesulfonate monooxygenase SsuD/methylene tetrahydromethanopterin reductase-like flavin-dependent oxidoreductase (luciferase family)
MWLGIGGAWFETEHTAFGIPFGSGFGERLDWFDESVELMKNMLPGGPASARGRFYHAKDVVNNPPPVQEHLPIMIGGSGERKTLHTVAKYADAWNTSGDLEHGSGTRTRCFVAGATRSAAITPRSSARSSGSVPIIRDTEAEARKVAEAMKEHNTGLARSAGRPFGPGRAGRREWARVPRPRLRAHLHRLPGAVRPRDDRAARDRGQADARESLSRFFQRHRTAAALRAVS